MYMYRIYTYRLLCPKLDLEVLVCPLFRERHLLLLRLRDRFPRLDLPSNNHISESIIQQITLRFEET